jgi:transcriptional antiterminator RfaH
MDVLIDPVGSEVSPGRGAPWIVVNTQPHRERLAVEHIRNQGFNVYCPMMRRRIKHARRTYDALRPLFPSYLFVALDPDQTQWRPLMSTIGVRSVVRNGERPSILDHRFVAAMQAREIEGAIVKPTSPYRVGDMVKMSGGAFDSFVAEIIALDDRQRLVVLLDFLNQRVKVRVEAHAVVPADLR